MPGINSIFNIGRWALFAFQNSIEVTGNNIANVNTEGYSRRSVNLEEGISLDYAPGQMGTGVKATEVIRHFDEFVEEQFNIKSALRERWSTLYDELRDVENIFNESDAGKINEAMSAFWQDWQSVSLRPEDTSARSVLLGDTGNLVNSISLAKSDLQALQATVNEQIENEVDEVNSLIRQITDLNAQINSHDIPGQNNANALYDQRALLVRQLAEKIDINYIDNGGGNITITTAAGHTLVDGQSVNDVFSLTFEGTQTFKDLTSTSTFDGDIYFEGSSDYEYTIEVVTAGDVGAAVPAEFRVSIDGGQTWLTDNTGNDVFEAQEYGQRVTLPDGYLKVWFGASGNSQNPPADPALLVGDRFTVMPKSGLYWHQNTSSKMNITPLTQANGVDDASRVTGGTLSGLFTFRDYYAGRYKEKLDSFAKSLAWEVNRLHSQGAGLDRYTDLTGTYKVENTTEALGDPRSGCRFNDLLQAGNLTMYVYDAATGALVSTQNLDMDAGTAGIQNFDPATHTLVDVQTAFNNMTNITASITNNQVRLTADAGFEIAFGSDTTGLFAALGLNTYFQGHDATTIALNQSVENNLELICAGHVNGAGEMNPGDNTTALVLAGLQSKDVSIKTSFEGTTSQTLSEYFNSLLGNVGSDTEVTNFKYLFQKSLADDLKARQEEVSGVNLDEEMSNLMKFQHSYTAASKLISTADEMFQVLLGLKQ